MGDAGHLREGECRIVRAGALEIGVFRVRGGFRAWRNVCPHEGAPVCRGTVEGTMLASRVYEYRYDEDRPVLRCPWHGWEYDLQSGRHLCDPAVRLQEYPVVERADGVYLVVATRAGRRSSSPPTETRERR